MRGLCLQVKGEDKGAKDTESWIHYYQLRINIVEDALEYKGESNGSHEYRPQWCVVRDYQKEVASYTYSN